MKKYWFLANVLIILSGIFGILYSLKGHEEKDFLFHLSSEEMNKVKAVKPDDVEIKYEVVEIKATVPFNAINLSAFNVTKRHILPAGATIWKAKMVINKYPDGQITSGMAMHDATFFDSQALDRHRNMALPQSLEGPTTSSLDIVNQIELQKVFYDLVMVGRFIYLMLSVIVGLILGNIGIWLFFRQRRQKEDRLDLIEEVSLKIESEPFKKMLRLLRSNRELFTEDDGKLCDRIDKVEKSLLKFSGKWISIEKFQQELDELEFDTMFLEVTVVIQRVQLRLDAIHFGNLHASYAGMQNEKPELGTVVREVVNSRLPSTPGVISPRNKFNELNKRIDALFAKMSQFKMSDQPQLASYERGVIEKIRSKLEKLDEVMVLISEELTRSGDRVKIKRFDYVENRIGAAELSFEGLEQLIKK